MKTALIATALAASLALGGAAKPAKAATAEEIAAILAGLAIVGVIASATSNKNRAQASTRDAPLTVIGRNDGKAQSRNVLPADCLVQVRTNRGVRNLAGERCLERNGVRTSRLPDRCEVQVRVDRGVRDAYGQRCLEQAGFRFRDTGRREDWRHVEQRGDRHDDRYGDRPVIQRRY